MDLNKHGLEKSVALKKKSGLEKSVVLNKRGLENSIGLNKAWTPADPTFHGDAIKRC